VAASVLRSIVVLPFQIVPWWNNEGEYAAGRPTG
jgi:hypothetical protein